MAIIAPNGYYDALLAKNKTHFKMVFYDAQLNSTGYVLTDDDIDLSVGVKIVETINKGSDFRFGGVSCREFSTRIILTERTEGISWSGSFAAFFGVEDGNDNIIWVRVGQFYPEKPKKYANSDVVDIIAYDMARLFEQPANDFLDGLSFPITPRNLVLGIGNALSMNIGIDLQAPLASIDRSFNNNHFVEDSYTFKDILVSIAEACGCFIRVEPSSSYDILRINWFEETYYYSRNPIERNRIFREMHSEETGSQLYNGVYVNKIDSGANVKYPAAATGNLYDIKENPIMYIRKTAAGKQEDTNNYVVPIYDRIVDMGDVLPMSVECYGDFCVQAGDIVSVTVPEGVIHMPIFYKVLQWNGMPIDKYETLTFG